MTTIISRLTGGYTTQPVIHDLSFSIPSGQIVALIGLNGAGKSTTIKHIMGLLKAHKGQVEVNGVTIEEGVSIYSRRIAYVPEEPYIYPELTLREHIQFTGISYGLSPEAAEQAAAPLLKLFRLDDQLDNLPRFFSKGMRQKVMIVCALMLDCDLYVIDEPFLGLDPLAIHDLIKVLNEKKNQGKAILLSTHILSTAEQVSDQFVLLHKGHLSAQGTLEEIRNQVNQDEASLEDLYFLLTEEGDERGN